MTTKALPSIEVVSFGRKQKLEDPTDGLNEEKDDSSTVVTPINGRRSPKLPRVSRESSSSSSSSSSGSIELGIEGRNFVKKENSSQNLLKYSVSDSALSRNRALYQAQSENHKKINKLLEQTALSYIPAPLPGPISSVIGEHEITFIVDDNGLVFHWSRLAEKFLGWSEQEAVSKLTLEEILPDYEKFKEYLYLGSIPVTKHTLGEQDKALRRLFVSKTENTEVFNKEGKKLAVEIQIRADKLPQLTERSSKRLYKVFLRDSKYPSVISPKSLTSFTSILSRKNSKTDIKGIQTQLKKAGSFDELIRNKHNTQLN